MAADLYSLLGVDKRADDKTIKSAYRKLARKYHPDVNPGDKQAESKFKEISNAYEVIGDPEKRKLYDKYGAQWEDAQRMKEQGYDPGPGGGGGSDFDFGNFGGSNGGGFGTIFEQFFQQGRSDHQPDRPKAVQAKDIDLDVRVTLEEIDAGTKRTLTYLSQDACKTCEGTGYVRARNGSLERCPTCSGAATLSSQRKVEVKIPAGIGAGQKLRVPGGGTRGANGRTGDLYVVVSELEHMTFKRYGGDLESEVEVPLATALLGGEIEVQTLRGNFMLKIAECTQSGQRLRLANQGITKLKSADRGSLTVKVKISMPKSLTPKLQQLAKELAAENEVNA